jgi:hypothetical protein
MIFGLWLLEVVEEEVMVHPVAVLEEAEAQVVTRRT